MHTFTFIMEFKGGTYINQISAIDLRHAMIAWANKLDTTQIKYLGERSQIELVNIIQNELPIRISGLSNVWCFSVLLKVGFIIGNIVLTDAVTDVASK